MNEGLAAVSDARLYYRDSGGDGAPVVFLHAATGSAFVWEHQEGVFVNAGYRTITYSRRGHAQSDRGPNTSTASAAQDLHRLLDVLGAGRCHLVAVAGGGAYALDYALTYSDRVRSLVIAGSMLGIEDEDYRTISDSLRPKGFDGMPPEFRELGPSYRALNPDGVARWKTLEHEAVTFPRVRQSPTTRVTWASLATLTMPVLLMTGDADLFMPPALMRMAAARIPGSQVMIIRDCGHAAHWEQAETFNRLTLDFLGRHAG